MILSHLLTETLPPNLNHMILLYSLGEVVPRGGIEPPTLRFSVW